MPGLRLPHRPIGMIRLSALLLSITLFSTLFPPQPNPTAGHTTNNEENTYNSTNGIRTPIAVMIASTGETLLVANRDSSSLSSIDTLSGKVSGEWKLAPELTACVASPDGLLIISAHRQPACIRLWQRTDNGLSEVAQLSVPEEPVALLLSDDGQTCFVSSLWARSLSVLTIQQDATTDEKLRIAATISLPFAPRNAVELTGHNMLLVADGFAGQLCVVDLAHYEIRRTLRIPGHNLRGLAWDAKRREIIVSHQILNQSAETSHDGVFWGIVMTNNLRVIPLANLLDDSREPLEDAYVHFLGDPKAGAADPTDLCVTGDRTMLVPLGGAGEVAMGSHLDHSFERIKVGRRPVSIVVDSAGRLAYVANMFSDTISVIDVAKRRQIREIPLSATIANTERPQRNDVQEGEALFYDASLSLDGWYSCHSCHPDGHSTQLLNDNLGDGNYGAPKRIPSLLGTGETGPWLWSGSQPDLQTQIHKSIVTTMQGEDPDAEQVRQLAAYVNRLPPPPRASTDDAKAVARGSQLFAALGCNHCHRPPTFTSPKAYDVGLRDQHGRREFNPPSLRGVRLRGPFFHDNRAVTLDDVFAVHQHQLENPLSDSDRRDLIHYLNSL